MVKRLYGAPRAKPGDPINDPASPSATPWLFASERGDITPKPPLAILPGYNPGSPVEANERKVLEVGCGNKKYHGAIGIDRVHGPCVDVVHDINTFPWPFKENTFDEVRLSQIIEHVDDILLVMNEIHRISKHTAKVFIWTPHFSSFNSWTDPTHKHHLAYGSLDLLTDQARYDYGTGLYQIVSRKIVFGKGLLCWPGRLMAALSPHLYEKYFCFMFPARDVDFLLAVVKSPANK